MKAYHHNQGDYEIYLMIRKGQCVMPTFNKEGKDDPGKYS